MPNSDMEKLWNALFPIAEKDLLRGGDFSPFAAGMRMGGIMVRVPEDLIQQGLTHAKRVQALNEVLVEQARAETICASCICYKTELKNKRSP